MATSEILAPNQQTAVCWKNYYDLTKPKVVGLILFTALVGMLLSVPGAVPLQQLIFGLIGIGLASAAGAVVNHVVDQRIDAVMERTRGRPIPTHRMDTPHALGFALALTTVSMLLLVTFVNPLTAVLTFCAFIGYAVIYTMFLKRQTPQNIVWGGLAGAAPPLLGWTAITGEVSSGAVLLLLIIFVWTPPHFWALAIRRREEYAKAGLPMLPVTHGVSFTKLQVVLYTLMLLAVSLLPFTSRMSGLLYLVGAVVLGLGFLYHAVKLLLTEGDQHAMKTFGYSIFYLTALFAVLLTDHYVVAFRGGAF